MTVDNGNPNRSDAMRRTNFLRLLVALLVAVGGIITAYHATIYGIKAELSTKADSKVVERIDARLIRIETILTETVATREELLEMRDQLNRQLAAIEAKLNMSP
jgi:hypothetical protein